MGTAREKRQRGVGLLSERRGGDGYGKRGEEERGRVREERRRWVRQERRGREG